MLGAENVIGTAGVAAFVAQHWEDGNIWGNCLLELLHSHIWCLGWDESKVISAGTADQVPPRGPSCLWASHRVLAGFWGMSLPRESGGSLEVACRPFCLNPVGWSSHGLSQIQGEETKTSCLSWKNIKEIGAMLYNHRQCPLNLRFCPQTIVSLEEGVPTQDSWPCVLSPSCALLHAKWPGLPWYLF